MIHRRSLAGALALSSILSLAACGRGRDAPDEAPLALKARDPVVMAGSSTRISLYFRHPSPALPVLGWEAETGLIVKTGVANEIIYVAPSRPGTAIVRATAVVEQTEYEASVTIRVADPSAGVEAMRAADSNASTASGFIDKLLFADSSPLYVSPREPSAVDPVTVKFRTRAGFGSRVTLHSLRRGEERKLEMLSADSDPSFEYHVAELPPGDAPIEYWFEIQSGSDRLLYSRSGSGRSAPSPAQSFRIVPGRRVPSWTRGAVVYRVDAAYFSEDGLEGLSRRADYLRSFGLDALLVSMSGRKGPWLKDEVAGPADRLAGKGMKTLIETAASTGGTDALAKEISDLVAGVAGLGGVLAPRSPGDDGVSTRLGEAIKAANPESALALEAPQDREDGSAWGDLVYSPAAFAEPVSAYLLGKTSAGKPTPSASSDAAAFARAFIAETAKPPQHMTENVLLSLEVPGALPFLRRARISAEEAQAGREAKDSYRLAFLMQMTMPGSPLIAGGAEAGAIRVDESKDTYPWGAEDKDLLSLHRDIGALRRAHAAFKTGSFALVAAEADGLLAYARWNEKERALVIVNASTGYAMARIPLGQLGLEEGAKLKTIASIVPGGHQASGGSYAVRSGAVSVPMVGRSAVVLLGPSHGESLPAAPSRPRALRSFPANGAKEIAEETRIIIQFSEPMDQESVEGAFSLEPAAAGVFVWNGDTCAFVPSAPLRSKTRYEVSVSKAMRSREGGFSMASGMAFGFTTR